MHELIIQSNEHIGMRLDRFLRLVQKEQIQQSVIENALRKKYVMINDGRGKSNYRLLNNDIVKIKNNTFDQKETSKDAAPYKPTKAILKELINSILYENDNIVIFDKPSGIACQAGVGLVHTLDRIAAFMYEGARIVHRIDKQTSGIVIVAKNLEYARILTDLFKNRLVTKTYIAVVCNWASFRHPDEFTINTPIIDEASGVALQACTHFRILGQFKRDDLRYSILEANPESGRKHQIRIHLANSSLPIVGDPKYNIRNFTKENMLLHAARLQIPSLNIDIESDHKKQDRFAAFLV